MRVTRLLLGVPAALMLAVALPALGQDIAFSTASPGAIDGPTGPGTTQFGDGDVVFMDPASGIGSIFLLADTINDGGLPDLNALHITSSGTVIFSTQSGAAGYDFQDDELVEYNPVTDTLSLYYDFGDLITTNADVDIDGFHVLSNGNFLISNTSDFTLDGQDFLNGDIVLFDPSTESASLLFSEGLFGGDDVWVRSVSMLGNGNLLFSAFNEDTGGDMTVGGLTFGRGDVVEYDLASGLAGLYVESSVFGGATEDIDALSVAAIPLPGAVWLFLSALAVMVRPLRRR